MWNESTIILAIIGMLGLFSTALVFQRANRNAGKYYNATKINQDLIKINEEMFY